MMNDLKTVWGEVEKLIADGLSLWPVRDHDEVIEGRKYFKKTPFGSWKRGQFERMDRSELFYLMTEKYNTNAVAVICGAVSGNLEVIDVDVKYLPGIDGSLFMAIRDVMPEVWSRLRIHRSPSGGFHILYRVYSTPVDGNKKLAVRPYTEAEAAEDAAAGRKPQPKCYIETRGEGGYIVAPPSMGYTVVNDNPIPFLYPEERESLLNICRSFNQLVKVEKSYTPTKSDDQYYDVNPFVDFNNSSAAETVLQDAGWIHCGQDSERIFFTRPGADKKGGVSAAFLRRTRLYYVFTTSTGLEAGKCMTPGTVLAELQFSGDKKKAYRWLVDNGYGRIKPKVEANIARNKALRGQPLPANASTDAQQAYDELTAQYADLYPFGVFWERTEEGDVKIHREKFLYVAEGLGFRAWKDRVVQIVGYTIHHRTHRFFFDAMKEYIKETDVDFYLDICSSFEAFIQRSGQFMAGRIAMLTEDRIIKDSPVICFKFFSNVFVAITSEGMNILDYESIEGLVWADKIMPRDFAFNNSGGKYLDFLRKAARFDNNPAYLMRVIGYLAHDHRDETTGYIIVLTEECPDPKQGGGSGKNLFCNLFANTISYLSVPGVQIRFDEKFLNPWNGERVFAISDVPKDFNFTFLKDMSTGIGLQKKLFKDDVTISVGDMPKFLLQSNFSYLITDGGLKRRIRPLEYTNFFTLCGGVDVHYGCSFPSGWSTADWNAYDTFMIACVEAWLAGGRKIEEVPLSAGGWQKQFDQSFGELTRVFIEEHIESFLHKKEVTVFEFNTYYEKYCNENGIPLKFRAGSKLMGSALHSYCAHYKIQFTNNINLRRMGMTQKYKVFGRHDSEGAGGDLVTKQGFW